MIMSSLPHLSYTTIHNAYNTVEPPNKGHVGTRNFVLYREVSFIPRLKCTGIIGIGMSRFVLYVLYSECPLSEVPLY